MNRLVYPRIKLQTKEFRSVVNMLYKATNNFTLALSLRYGNPNIPYYLPKSESAKLEYFQTFANAYMVYNHDYELIEDLSITQENEYLQDTIKYLSTDNKYFNEEINCLHDEIEYLHVQHQNELIRLRNQIEDLYDQSENRVNCRS